MKKQLFWGVGLTIVTVALMSWVWEFVLEDWIQGGRSESMQERMEYIFTTVTFIAIALIMPIILGLRIISKYQNKEEELLKMQEQLRNLGNKLQSSREEERTSIARGIHDELDQTLTALKLDLSWLKNNLQKNETHLKDKIEGMNHLIENTVQFVQQIASDLRPRILDLLGLCEALKWHTKEFQKRTGIDCILTITPENIELDHERSITIFRIYQEALTNVAKHSKANRVESIFKIQNDELVLEVSDNGIGMRKDEWENAKSVGLMGIRERIFIWEGKAQIKSKEGEGTTILVFIPLGRA